MNHINPNKLLNSKWTAVQPVNRQRHFIVTGVIKSDDGSVTACEIESVLTHKESELDWRELKDSSRWVMGWKWSCQWMSAKLLQCEYPPLSSKNMSPINHTTPVIMHKFWAKDFHCARSFTHHRSLVHERWKTWTRYATGNQLHTFLILTLTTATNQQMDMIRSNDEIENTKAKSFPGLKLPVQPTFSIFGELQ